MLDGSIASDLSRRLGSAITSQRAVRGGDIHTAYRLRLADGRDLFVKTSSSTPPGLFAAEVAGLSWLASFGVLPVPDVLAFRDSVGAVPGYLALQWHEPASGRRTHDAEVFGCGLARLHDHRQERPGWHRDVFIGPLAQKNQPQAHDWTTFWLEQRLAPMAVEANRGLDSATRRLLEDVHDKCGALLSDVTHFGPLHGDLWGGNALWADRGAMLIDPAVYAGDPEVDLAMMALFGGFPPPVWSAYFDVRPRAHGFEARRALYQMWPLLVHVALFGSGYCGQLASAARTVLAAV